MNNPNILTAQEVSAHLRISPQRAYELARLGLLPCIRIGRQVRFDEVKVEAWIAAGGRAYDQSLKNAA